MLYQNVTLSVIHSASIVSNCKQITHLMAIKLTTRNESKKKTYFEFVPTAFSIALKKKNSFRPYGAQSVDNSPQIFQCENVGNFATLCLGSTFVIVFLVSNCNCELSINRFGMNHWPARMAIILISGLAIFLRALNDNSEKISKFIVKNIHSLIKLLARCVHRTLRLLLHLRMFYHNFLHTSKSITITVQCNDTEHWKSVDMIGPRK